MVNIATGSIIKTLFYLNCGYILVKKHVLGKGKCSSLFTHVTQPVLSISYSDHKNTLTKYSE